VKKQMTREELYFQANEFLDDLFDRLAKMNISFPHHWDIDHICYRVDSLERYQQCRDAFQQLGNLLIESEVGGRPIATYKLFEPLWLKGGRSIDLVELPAPKRGRSVNEGFEHIEIVCDEPFTAIKKRYPGNEFNESGLQKGFNQELEMRVGDKAIKFHHLSLESVICLERNQKVFAALKEANLLKILSPYSPLIAGTFPLGISVFSSDVDVLLTTFNLEMLAEEVKINFGTFEGFKERFVEKDGVASWIAQFQFEGVSFELFAQPQESIKQKAYRHFQIEERLLKYGGKNLRQQILDYRSRGFKTEKAFASVLVLPGDSYEALLQIVKLSEVELRKRFF
jgi:predicted metalloenzyme YecM